MAKFNTKKNTGFNIGERVGSGPVRTVLRAGEEVISTYNGADARYLDQKSELFTLAVTNMVGENTFYESADKRDSRFVQLVRAVAGVDPEWVQRLLLWLRTEANLRSAALMGAAEYVRTGAPHGRQVVASVLRRADEPGELLAYWTSRYGRKVPQPIKRGIADAAKYLYNEYSIQKYDSSNRDFRFGDVIQLTHPKPQNEKQSALFKYALDRQYGNADTLPEELSMLQKSALLDWHLRTTITSEDVTSDMLKAAGWTWERLASYGALTKGVWASLIPTMGYMALLRNLRNFEQAGVSESVMKKVRARLADPEQVAHSKQLPFRFWSAYRQVENVKTKAALEEALEHSFKNIELPGRTLVLVDISSSMTWGTVSEKSSIRPVDIAKLMGVATALGTDSDLVLFNTQIFRHDVRPGGSIMGTIDALPFGGGGTNIGNAIRSAYDGHDRVVIFTDMQSTDDGGTNVPTYVFDLEGYGRVPDLGNNVILFGGWSDSFLKSIPLIERGKNADWPF